MAEHEQRVGRPRDSRIDHVLVEATRALLADVGYGRLTVDAVAARAGVGKAAIYRRYASKAELVFAATIHDLDIQAPPDAGSLRADLAALAHLIVTSLGGPALAMALPGLLADALGEPATSERFRAGPVARERACIVEILDRAVTRGEVSRLPDPDLVHALMLGPVFARLFLLRRPDHHHDFAEQLADSVAAALLGTDR